MNIRHPILFGALIGCGAGIILTYFLLQYTLTQNCPQQKTIPVNPVCPKCMECPACECPACYNMFPVSEAEIIPTTNREYMKIVGDEIRESRKTLHIIAPDIRYYSRLRNSSSNNLLQEIINAARRGVDVKILVDQSSGNNHAAYEYLQRNNVTVKYDADTITTKAKIILVDGETTILGTSDFTENSLNKNNEADIVIKSNKTTEYYEQYFQTLWNT